MQENENLLDEERVENNLKNNNDEMELDDIDLLQLEEEEEDYKSKYEKLFAEHEKTRKALVSYKKANKKSKQNTDFDDDLDARLDARLEMRDFYKNNPNASEYKEKIEDYVKKWLSRDDALYLLSRDEVEAKKSAEPKTIGRARVNTGFKKISANEFYKMTPKAQEDYMNNSIDEYGELLFE